MGNVVRGVVFSPFWVVVWVVYVGCHVYLVVEYWWGRSKTMKLVLRETMGLGLQIVWTVAILLGLAKVEKYMDRLLVELEK